MEEFRDAIKEIMGDVEDEELDIIFMKVDTNCDGTVDWEEYLNYMLLEYREKDSLQKQNLPLYFPKPLVIVPVAHCQPIVRLQLYPFQTVKSEEKGLAEQAASAPNSHMQPGRYLSISRDGILNYWSERFNLTRTVRLDHYKKKSQQIWITDMVCLSNLNLLAIASTGRDVEFYNISANKSDHVFSLTGLRGYVTAMNYWSDGRKGVFSVGDADGCVSVFISLDVIQNGLFNKALKSGSNSCFRVSALLKNTSELYLCFTVALHDDWCQQVRFLPELNAVATCCTSDHTAMVLTTIPHSHKAKVHKSTFQVRKGILCFDYSPELNILVNMLSHAVTGGFDRIVRIWNPYVTTTATSQMKGHLSAVISIAVNSQDNRIISISKDKNVCVWDLQQCECLQNIPSRNITMGQYPISSVFYNKDTNTLILATFMIGILYGTVDDLHTYNKLKTSHEQPLCAALYNANFKQVVSGCQNGIVSVWDILTGKKVMQFQTSPEKPVEITAMTFDGPKRRLITGSKDGTLRLWNFNNGALLLTLPLLDTNEVTGILYIDQRIYVSGWSKRVMWYLDAREDDELEYRVWNQYHAEDIYSMHAHSNKLLVTASYSGDITIWNIHSGQAIFRFNASVSPRPLLPYRVESPCLEKKSLNESPQFNEHTSNPISAEELEKPKHAVEKPRYSRPQVLFLCSRERSLDTAILLTSAADGYVYAWSIHRQGGLLGMFRAVYNEGVISSMSTDSQDQMLFTGDSKGYITLWDIEGYCYSMNSENRNTPGQRKRSVHLPTLIPEYCQIEGPRKMTLKQKTKDLDGWRVSLVPPPLLSSWRGHLKSIVCVEYVERFRLLVTASHDCTVRLWTIAGSYIGTFGQTLWCVGDPEACQLDLPVDLRRFGSFQTLKVLNKGTRPHWK
ncbi:hypothetical protein NFI96_010621 [Prochilodus magdalenae]|nr:hypothetical protein NFI96_010621 [Prochilodus magdalenae]